MKPGKRAGSQNYSMEDIATLLDLVEELEPIGSNDWAVVQNGYCEYATELHRQVKDNDSLRGKFDKLANTKKPTGDQSCPPAVRCEKHIARLVLGDVNEFTAGSDDSDTSEQEAAEQSTNGSTCAGSLAGTKRRAESALRGVQKNKRRAGATGVATKDNDDEDLVGHVANMSEALCGYIEIMKGKEGSDTRIGSEEIRHVVRTEVQDQIEKTNNSVDELKDIGTRTNREKDDTVLNYTSNTTTLTPKRSTVFNCIFLLVFFGPFRYGLP